MSGRYVVWRYESTPLPARLIVGWEDYDLLLDELLSPAAAGSFPVEVLRVSGHLADQRSLVAYLAEREESESQSRDEASISIVSLLCAALTDYAAPQAELRQHWRSLVDLLPEPPVFCRLVELLLDFYADVETVFLASGVADLSISHERRPAWWSSKPRIVRTLEQLKASLLLEIREGTDLTAFFEKVEEMLVVARRLERAAAGRSSETFVAAGAYCFCCAELYQKRRLPSAALMMLNRASEFVLTALALEAGLATISPGGVLLSAGEQPSVVSFIRALVSSGHFNQSLIGKTKISAINATRNQLGFTHGLANVCLEHVDEALQSAALELRNIDPSLGWWSMVKQMRPMLPDARWALALALDFERLVERIAEERLRRDAQARAEACERNNINR